MSRKKMKKSKKIAILSSVVKYVGISFALAGLVAGAIMASFAFPIIGVALMFAGIAGSVVLEAKAEEQATKEIKPKKYAYVVEDFEETKEVEKQTEKQNETYYELVEEKEDEKSFDFPEKTL